MRERFLLTRRGFLGASAVALGASALPPGVLAQSAKYRRWEISDASMPGTVLASYKRAIREMLKRPPTDARNWYRNAFVHLLDCPHQNWWFLPWHRAYLGWLERTCRDLSGDSQFALPYWDWTKTSRVPAAMFDDVLDPNNAPFDAAFDKFKEGFEAPIAALWDTFSRQQRDFLAQRGLNSTADLWGAIAPGPFGMFFEQPNARGLTAASPDLDRTTKVTVSLRVIRDALRASTFAGDGDPSKPAGFGSDKTANHIQTTREGILESQPHDNVHGAIGGPRGLAFMVSFLSPVDPIFFLHHGNIDRLWDVWTRRQQALGRPTLPQGADLTQWSNEQFLFFSDENGAPVTKTRAGDYATMSVFEYDYSPGSGEDEVPLSGAAIAAIPAPVPAERFSARIAVPSITVGTPGGGVADVPAVALKAVGTPGAPPAVAEITLNLTRADQGRRFRVLVSLPGRAGPIEAGGITIFSHHIHGPMHFTVPLPESLGAIIATESGNVPLDISVVPVELEGRKSGPQAPQVGAIQVRTN